MAKASGSTGGKTTAYSSGSKTPYKSETSSKTKETPTEKTPETSLKAEPVDLLQLYRSAEENYSSRKQVPYGGTYSIDFKTLGEHPKEYNPLISGLELTIAADKLIYNSKGHLQPKPYEDGLYLENNKGVAMPKQKGMHCPTCGAPLKGNQCIPCFQKAKARVN